MGLYPFTYPLTLYPTYPPLTGGVGAPCCLRPSMRDDGQNAHDFWALPAPCPSNSFFMNRSSGWHPSSAILRRFPRRGRRTTRRGVWHEAVPLRGGVTSSFTFSSTSGTKREGGTLGGLTRVCVVLNRSTRDVDDVDARARAGAARGGPLRAVGVDLVEVHVVIATRVLQVTELGVNVRDSAESLHVPRGVF